MRRGEAASKVVVGREFFVGLHLTTATATSPLSSTMSTASPTTTTTVAAAATATATDPSPPPPTTTTTVTTTLSSCTAAYTSTDFDAYSHDVGNVVWFEHVNLNVPRQSIAQEFYCEGLGLTRDPHARVSGRGTIWINVGASQIHLPLVAEKRKEEEECKEKGGGSGSGSGDGGGGGAAAAAAQRAHGRIWLRVPDLKSLMARLDKVEKGGLLSDTDFAYKHSPDAAAAAVFVRGPYGNQFVVVGPESEAAAGVGGSEVVPRRHLLALHRMDIYTPVGTCHGIARFYQLVLGALVAPLSGRDQPQERWWDTEEEEEGAGGEEEEEEKVGKMKEGGMATRSTATTAAVRVRVGPDQELVFWEREGCTALEAQPDDWHLCIYVSSFRRVYERCVSLGIAWNNPRFSDQVAQYTDAKRWNQFRIRDIVDTGGWEVEQSSGAVGTVGDDGGGGGGGGGERLLLLRLEHEIRSMHHPSYMRPLVNRLDQRL